MAEQRTFSNEPAVDWPGSRDGIETIVSETIDITYVEGGRGRLEQVLGRTPKAVVLLTRLEDDETHQLTRMVVPIPLDDFESTIEPCRNKPDVTFALHLQPEQLDGIVCTQSTQLEDGRWENRTTQGVPIYGMFESTDRDRLENLRNRLFGTSAAAQLKVQDEVRSDPTALERLNSLSPEDRLVATLLAAQKVKAELEQRLATGPSSIDAAEAFVTRHKITLMDEAIARALSAGAQQTVDPETRRRVEAAIWPK